MKKLLKWILPMVIVAAAIPVFPSLKAEVEPVKVEAEEFDETIVLAADETLTEPKVFDSGKNILLDLNGHTITENFAANKMAALFVKNNTKLTVRDSVGNGKVFSDGQKIGTLINMSDGELNIEANEFKCNEKIIINLFRKWLIT